MTNLFQDLARGDYRDADLERIIASEVLLDEICDALDFIGRDYCPNCDYELQGETPISLIRDLIKTAHRMEPPK